ncbi:sensor histidine kinase [Saccharospirillum mangrovi]|uniref:sensor histidine kinase n=1 Tax=Saccharospirillum mangrovi TaxID=2161747 RepID=UPI0013008DFA|nr:ATP-binding protein [Saccharospirillum mangrovi]
MTDKTSTTDRPFQPKLAIHFSWPSSFAALGLITYLFLATEPDIAAYYGLTGEIFVWQYKVAAMAVFALLLWWDAHRYGRDKRRHKRERERLRGEINQLWDSRKQLQRKAHAHAGQADKLKLFISDKLLEYIEYDEKFLHFKSIAAEVRHNGVISFDKVQGALEAAHAGLPEGDMARRMTGDALEQLRYLWDLLDLATADNIALHIANQMFEFEEQYYQRELNAEATATWALQPDFSPVRALQRALLPMLEKPTEFSERLQSDLPLQWSDDSQFHVHIEPTGNLLGNENHWVLMLENLLKNAQFFSGKRPYRHKHRRIAIALREQQGHAHLSVFNGGPPISADDQQRVFQLGYSTRRVKEHHGKGLGLFFVGEIVKGYEGQVRIRNIENTPARLSLRVTLKDGRVVTDMIETQMVDELPQVKLTDGTLNNERRWQLDHRAVEVEIAAQGRSEPHRLALGDSSGKTLWLDPENPGRPAWALQVQCRRRDTELVFTPLDVRGVAFDVAIPLAASRLDDDSSDLDLEPDLDRLNEPFRALEDFRDTGTEPFSSS